MSTFGRFPDRLQQAIVSRLGWTSLRAVQELAGAAILDGKNAVVLAPTAGGKTEAAMFPVLASLLEEPPEGVGAVYIAPIKALLNNQEERLGTYTQMVALRRFVWHGDTSQAAKTQFMKEPAELLMTTPESLEVMLLSPRVPVARLFTGLRFAIIDEVHALAGTDRGAHLMSVLERLQRVSKTDIQRVGLSATVGNPEEIATWLGGSSERERVVVDPPKQPAPRSLEILHRPEMLDLAREAARRAVGKKSLFFCQSRALTESVADHMAERGTEVFVHHSSVSLEERRAAEESFHRGKNVAIACTSTLELGIDVGDLDLVFQANAPSTVSSFMQRMGRTGRRDGAVANTTFFCDEAASVLQAVALIELAREGWVENVAHQTRCWPVLAHQLLAMTLQFGGVSKENCWDQLHRVPDFSEITAEEFDALITHMLREDYLFESGGLLSMGTTAERTYGRRNFSEIYAVFSSPVLYRVESATGRDIGSLEQNFVDRLVEDISSFLLSGRAWTVEHINHQERTIRVHPAPRGKMPAWGGYIPQMLGYEICQRIRDVVASDAEYPYLDARAAESIVAIREDLGPLLSRDVRPIRTESGIARWWTFAGGRINHTVKYALQCTESWKVVADNFMVRIEGNGVSHDSVNAALDRLGDPEYWVRERLWERVLAALPEYRLSKFQQALPERMQVEMVGDYLLDRVGVMGVVGPR